MNRCNQANLQNRKKCGNLVKCNKCASSNFKVTNENYPDKNFITISSGSSPTQISYQEKMCCCNGERIHFIEGNGIIVDVTKDDGVNVNVSATGALDGNDLIVSGNAHFGGSIIIHESDGPQNGINAISFENGLLIFTDSLGNTSNIGAGVTGSVGHTGPDEGFQGFQGATGTQGIIGIQGATGSYGHQGSQGEFGYKGKTGLRGYQGQTGDMPRGLQGDKGPQGVTGQQGLIGIGVTGMRGDRGFQGEGSNVIGRDGPRGHTGYGPQGSMGEDGLIGENGFDGTAGYQGITGPLGIQGHRGTQGFQGFQGFQGETGSQGIEGLQGQTGPIGFTGLRGHTGSEGLPGKQSYLGHQGYKGPQGHTGGVGGLGAQGHTGSVGEMGEIGLDGPQGLTGPQGFQGVTGSGFITTLSCHTGQSKEQLYTDAPESYNLILFERENNFSICGSIAITGTTSQIYQNFRDNDTTVIDLDKGRLGFPEKVIDTDKSFGMWNCNLYKDHFNPGSSNHFAGKLHVVHDSPYDTISLRIHNAIPEISGITGTFDTMNILVCGKYD